MRGFFSGVLMLWLGACAQKNVISQVNQFPLFQPSLISYAARDGAVPLEIHGAVPAGMAAAALAQALHLPGRSGGVRLITQEEMDSAPPAPIRTPAALIRDRLQTMTGAGGHEFRIVLVFDPHFQTLPGKACEAAHEIPAGGGQDIRVLAAFCIGRRLAASGQVRAPAQGATPQSISYAINLLLTDMAHPRPDRGFADTPRR